MEIVAIAAQKGGVGKTTTAVYLGLALARRGVSVLVVDLDHQGHATALLKPSERPVSGTADMMLSDAALVDVAVRTPSGVDLCAGASTLARAELALVSELGREKILRTAMDAVPAGRWEVCLLDCPPSLGLLTTNALTAASAVLSPVEPAYLSILAVRELEDTLAKVQARLNPALRRLGYLLCAVDARERLAGEARALLRGHLGTQLWPVEVRVDARLKSAPNGQALHGRAGDDYEAVTDELMRRLRAAPETKERLKRQSNKR